MMTTTTKVSAFDAGVGANGRPVIDVSRLPPEKRAEYMRLREARDGGEWLDPFIRRISAHHPPPRHYAPIVRQLELAMRMPGKVNCCISLPPRHGKTTLIQHAIAWWLSRRPADTCAYVSYNNEIAYSKSFETRDLALAANVDLSNRQNLAEWRTAYGGGLLSTGVGGGLTGKGVSGLMVFDDPYKNMRSALSAKVREEVMSTYDSVVQARIECASTFIIHTRWAEDDLIGTLGGEEGWVVINIPAISEGPGDVLDRPMGEPLWGERFGLEYLNKRKRRNQIVFQALYQGQPVAVGGRVFGPAHYYDQKTFDPEGKFIVIGGDPATDDNPAANWSVIVALYVEGLDPETMKVYAVDVYREQVQIPDYVDEVVSFQARHGNAPIAVEAVAGFKAVPQMLRKLRPNIDVTEAPALGNKYLRAQFLAELWNDGRFLVPLEAPWLAAFLAEFKKFTGFGDKEDDQVDGTAHAVNSIGGVSIYDALKG